MLAWSSLSQPSRTFCDPPGHAAGLERAPLSIRPSFPRDAYSRCIRWATAHPRTGPHAAPSPWPSLKMGTKVKPKAPREGVYPPLPKLVHKLSRRPRPTRRQGATAGRVLLAEPAEATAGANPSQQEPPAGRWGLARVPDLLWSPWLQETEEVSSPRPCKTKPLGVTALRLAGTCWLPSPPPPTGLSGPNTGGP